jgi:hypothetical protein
VLASDPRLREGQLDATALPAGRGDRGIGVGQQLGNDLAEIDAALSEALTVIAPADRADTQLPAMLPAGTSAEVLVPDVG